MTIHPRRWAWLGVLLAGLALYIAVLVTLVQTQNPNFIPSMILLGSSVVPAAFLAYASGRLGIWHVSGGTLAVTAFLGGRWRGRRRRHRHGLRGAALWQLAGERTGRALTEFVATYLVVSMLHAAWDFFGNVVAYLVVGAISIGWLR